MGKKCDMIMCAHAGFIKAVARGAQALAKLVVSDAAAAVNDSDILAAPVLQDFVE